ncbi:MAG: tetratricopeptide repeat protein [Acidobacteriota bacterium]
MSSRRTAVAWGAAAAAGMAVVVLGVWHGSQSDSSPPTALNTSAPVPTQANREALSLPLAESSPDPVYAAMDAVRAGNVAYAQGNLESARAAYLSAVEASPRDAEAHSNLAQVLVRQGQAEEALHHLDEAVKLEPERWSYRFNRARAYGHLERWQESVDEYRAAVRLFPDDYATHYNLGLALLRLERYQDAARALERSVALAPGEPGFLITLGTALVGAEQRDKARASFERFLDLAPDHADAPRVRSLLAAMRASN